MKDEGKTNELINTNEQLKQEVAKRKLAEEALRETEEKFRNIFEQSPIGIALYDPDGQLLDLNKACLDIFGVSGVAEIQGLNLFDDLNVSDELEERLRKGEMLRDKASFDFENVEGLKLHETTKSGIIFFDLVITPLGLNEKEAISSYLVQIHDITEHQKAEEELRSSYSALQYSQDESIRSERLAFTGRIAASIAHEIRNPLTNVLMSVQQIKKAFKPENPWAKHIEIITRNTERINYLITELLNCARPPKLDIHPYDMHRLLEGVLESVQTKIKSEKVEVVKRFTSKPSIISMDKEQMERVFSNIILNAIEAMPRGGNLTIVTKVDGNLFVVKVGDTGEGIPEEDIIRIFDPFFSSKPSGVGLGLTICYGIIVSHGGTTEVESKPKEGTVFTVSLPVGGGARK